MIRMPLAFTDGGVIPNDPLAALRASEVTRRSRS